MELERVQLFQCFRVLLPLLEETRYFTIILSKSLLAQLEK